MVDNFDLIKGLLEFRNDDDFYFLQIIQRKKDHKSGKVNGTNNNSRLVKAYYISSLEYFDFIKPEVIQLCKVFNARAGINLNRRSYKRAAFHTLKKVTDQILNENYNKVHKAYNSVCGSYSSETDKKWILDIDQKIDEQSVQGLKIILSSLQPEGPKYITTIPSKNGVHIITRPFNIQQWKQLEVSNHIEIHKNNPTNIYIP